METIERTPTPRELLFSLQQHLQQLISSETEFCLEVAKIAEGEDIDPDDTSAVAQATKLYNEHYLVTARDEDGETISKQSALTTLKQKYSVLAKAIEGALVQEDFGNLLRLIEAEQLQVHNNSLFEQDPEADSFEVEGDLEPLARWYNDFLEQIIKAVERIYNEPEFDLRKLVG